jgi:hypothetical protein
MHFMYMCTMLFILLNNKSADIVASCFYNIVGKKPNVIIFPQF